MSLVSRYFSLATELFLEQFIFFEFPPEKLRWDENDFLVLLIARACNKRAEAILNTLQTLLPIRGPFNFPDEGHSKYQLVVIFWDGLVSPGNFDAFSNFLGEKTTAVIVDMAKYSVSVKFDDNMFRQKLRCGKVIRVFARPPRFFFDWFPFPWCAIRYLMHLKKRVAKGICRIIVNEGKLEDKYGRIGRF